MQDLLTLLGSFSVVFLAGYLTSKFVISRKSNLQQEAYQPVENAKVRMKTSSSLYRCRLISHSAEGWVFTAPMQRDTFVPIAVGEAVTCEVIGQGGLLVFQTSVIARRAGEGAIVVAAPKSVTLENRREESDRREIPMEVTVAGKSGSVMDLSPGGARVRIRGFEREGNVVQINLPTGEVRGATVVDSKNDHVGSVVRLRFHEPIQLASE